MISQPGTLLNNCKNSLLTTMAIVLCFGNIAAQGWERFYGGNKVDRGHAIIQTNDRGFLMVGFSESFGTDNDQDVYVVKTDIDGTLVWTNVYDESFIEQGNDVIQAANGDLIIVGTIKDISSSYRDLYVLSISASGKFLWSKRYSGAGNRVGKSITHGVDGGYVIVGETTTPDNEESDVLLLKIDRQGNEIWTRSFGREKDDEGTAVTTIGDGYAVVANSEGVANRNDIILYRVDAEGKLKWQDMIGTEEVEEANDIIATRDGGLAITGNIKNNRDLLVAKYNDDTGRRLWLVSTGNKELAEVGKAIIELENGDLVVAGHAEQNSINVDFFMAGFSADGDSLWQNKTGDVVNVDFTEGIVNTEDGGFAIVGYNSKFLDSFNDLTLVKTDGRGNTITSFIQGNLFSEPCNNFEPTGKLPLSDWLVEARGEEKTYYGSTDENGRYSIRVDSGSYLVSVLPVNSYWKTCVPGGFIVNIEEPYDTTSLDFPISAEINCPFLEVDISTPFLASCSEVVYTVSYCNLGTAIARDAYVQINLDNELLFESSSIAFSEQEGSKYIFDLGTLGVSQCGSFTINTSLACDGIANGQAALASAHIFPDTICTEPDPNWDGSSIVVRGECRGDSIAFIVKNVGDSDMVVPKNAVVIASDVIFLKYKYQLQADEESLKLFPKTGDTYRIIAEQSDGHPGRSFPTLAIEGCTSNGGGDFETGFVTQFAENDQDPYISIDAKEILSFDNAVSLRGYPKGYGADALIASTTDIKYTITFSNDGTDTISRIVIRDTLPAGLDIATLMPGTSSHPYKFEVYDEGIIKFTFDNISLIPESSASNQSTSMGYVSFDIAQKPGNEPGTTINNSAAIFFENQSPVFSNVVRHKVDEFPGFVPEKNVVSVDPQGQLAGIHISVQPNPFQEMTIFEIDSEQTLGEIEFELYDPYGKLIRREMISDARFEFHRMHLSSGMYYYKLNEAGKQRMIGTGKILIQ